MTADRDYKRLLKAIAGNIRRLRLERAWTQEDLAERGGFNYRYYQKLESGVYSPNLRTLHRLASALKVDIKDLLP